MIIVLLYLKLWGASLTGMFIQLISKSSDMENTAKKSNVIYEGFWAFLKRDWKAIIVNILAILATFLIFGKATFAMSAFMADKTYAVLGFDIPLTYLWDAFVALFFFSTGYMGQDFILRRVMKSVQNRLIKEAIDYKTTIADKQNGTLDKPTPLQ